MKMKIKSDNERPGSNLGLLVMLLISLPLAGFSTAEDLPRGTPIDAVVCAADAGQSYALYLPSAYSCDRRWPILYCFDPGARGPVPIRLFRSAAEKYGFILVCSNHSRNGPWEPIRRALQAVWTDTQKRFCIDNERVYSAGHSGGAQVALLFGFFLGRPWAGVISCCGGLPNPMPTQALPKDLAVFITTGLCDFNYWPSRKIASKMDELGVANHLEIFANGHAWLTSDVASDALSWLELQAMKKGKRKRDDAWIASQFEERLQRAQEIEQAKKSVEAHEAYLALASDFRDLIDVAPAESSAARLAQPEEIETYRAAMEAAEKEESLRFARSAGALRAFTSAANDRERHRCLGELGIPGLRKEAESGDHSAAGLAARRILGFLFVRAAIAAAQAYEQGDMKTAKVQYGLTVLIQPESGFAWFNLACVYSRLGKKKDALRALETAVRNGVQDWEAIEKDPDFAAIRREPAYLRLLGNLKKNPSAKKP
jgi:dienelactone hydrolase